MLRFTRASAVAAPVAVLVLLLSGCDTWPADPRNSLAAAEQRGALRVGVVANPPWVEISSSELNSPDAPAGLESELVSQFASQMGLDIQWHSDGVEQQVEALKNFGLDLMIGGFSAANPWKAEVGQTFIYFSEHNQSGSLGDHVILTAPGENALLMALERFLFTRQDPERYIPHLQETSQP